MRRWAPLATVRHSTVSGRTITRPGDRVTLGDISSAAALLSDVSAGHAGTVARPGAGSAVRSGSSARTSSARLVQDPRRLQPDARAHHRGAARRGGRGQCREPRSGGRAGRRLLEVPATVFMPRLAALPSRRHPELRRRLRLVGDVLEQTLAAAAEFATRPARCWCTRSTPAGGGRSGTVGLELFEQRRRPNRGGAAGGGACRRDRGGVARAGARPR